MTLVRCSSTKTPINSATRETMCCLNNRASLKTLRTILFVLERARRVNNDLFGDRSFLNAVTSFFRCAFAPTRFEEFLQLQTIMQKNQPGGLRTKINTA
jgi:hypothetical protein